MIKRILIGLGGTPYAASKIRYAIEIARRFDAHLTGVTVFDEEHIDDIGPVPVGGGPAAAELREYRSMTAKEHIQEAIDQFTDECSQHQVAHHIIREQGDPFDDLISLWRYHDLTVLGLQGLFEYGVLPSSEDAVTRVIARGVRPIIAVGRNHHEIHRVLVAYNGSMESAKAMKQFVQLRLWPDAELGIACFGDPHEGAKNLLHAARSYCQDHGFDAEIFAQPRDSSRDIIAFASEWNANMIVLGSTSRSRILRMVLGDTVRDLIHNADIPLFLSQ